MKDYQEQLSIETKFSLEWKAAKGGYIKTQLDSAGQPVVTFVPACRKCLTTLGKMYFCMHCAEAKGLIPGVRYYCHDCLRNHKNPEADQDGNCSDCGIHLAYLIGMKAENLCDNPYWKECPKASSKGFQDEWNARAFFDGFINRKAESCIINSDDKG